MYSLGVSPLQDQVYYILIHLSWHLQGCRELSLSFFFFLEGKVNCFKFCEECLLLDSFILVG